MKKRDPKKKSARPKLILRRPDLDHSRIAKILTVPMPNWVKSALDVWMESSNISSGRVFRCVNKSGAVWATGVTEKVDWSVVKECAAKANIAKLAPATNFPVDGITLVGFAIECSSSGAPVKVIELPAQLTLPALFRVISTSSDASDFEMEIKFIEKWIVKVRASAKHELHALPFGFPPLKPSAEGWLRP